MNETASRQSEPERADELDDKSAGNSAGNTTRPTARVQSPLSVEEAAMELRKAAVREQALREKLRRLEHLASQIDDFDLPPEDAGKAPSPASSTIDETLLNNTLAGLSDKSWDEIKDQLDSLHQEAETFVRDHPTQGVLTAAAVGFVLGLLTKR